MNTCPECNRFLGDAGHRPQCSKRGLSPVRSEPLLGPMPLPSLEYEIIVHQRSGQCAGCEWHPDVCKHCLQTLNDDNDNGSPGNGGEERRESEPDTNCE
jgi:hypothetical protein